MLAQLAIVEEFLMTNFARFIQRLKDTKDHEGRPMLDTTQVLFGSGLGLARLGLPAAIAPTVVTDAQKQEVRNKRARPDASGADDDDDDGGGGGRSPQSGSGDRRRSKAARRSL